MAESTSDSASVSLTALREAHLGLLERQPIESESPTFLDACAVFIDRAQALGALLDHEGDRAEVQTMINYWATRLIRGGRDLSNTSLAEFDIEQSPDLNDVQCPYRGLAAFHESDDHVFFGRDWLANDMLDRLKKGGRLLAVIGSSGSGKSSVVLASLVPKLKAGGLPGSGGWRYAAMVPGSDPATSLRRAVDGASGSSEALVLVIDQFEEVFTLCADERKRAEFVQSVVELIHVPAPKNIVIVTMRTEFVDNVAKLPSFWPLFRSARVDVEAMSADELRAAIEKPAAKVGLKFADGIVDDLVNKILGERAGLPLLQFTLLKLWEKRRRNRITWEVYKDIGNPRVALARSADAFFDGLIPQHQDAVKRILLKMVRPADGLEFTSSRIPRSTVFAKNVSPVWVDDVLNRLIAAGLVKETRGVTDADTQIEVAHEALVRNWPKLVTWLDDERTTLQERFRLADAARRWQNRERDAGLLLRGRSLEEATRYDDLNALERDFVQVSRAVQDGERLMKEEANRQRMLQAEALAREQKLRADQQARANGQLRAFIGALGLTSLVAIGLLAWALASSSQANQAQIQALQAQAQASAAQATAVAEATRRAQSDEIAELSSQQAMTQKERADAQATRATEAQATSEASQRQSRLVATALSLKDANTVRSLLVALEALDAAQTVEAEDALRQALSAAPLLLLRGGHTNTIRSVAFVPNGERVVTAGADGTAHIWDAESGEILRVLQVMTNTVVIDVQVSRDGRNLWAMSNDGKARLFDIDTGMQLTFTQLPTDTQHAQLSEDGRLIVSAGSDGLARVWDTQTASPPIELRGHQGAVNRARFSAQGDRVVTAGDDGTARIWDIATGLEITPTISISGAPMADAQFSPDGTWVVTAGDDGLVRVWSLANPAVPRFSLSGHTLPVNSVHVSPDGRRILSAGADGSAMVWNVASGRLERVLRGHSSGLNDARFSRDGSRIVTAGDDQVAEVWSAQAGAEIASSLAHPAAVRQAKFSMDGKRLVTTADDHIARIWNAQTGRLIAQTPALQTAINEVRFGPQDRFVTAGNDGSVRIWDGSTARLIRTLNASAKIDDTEQPLPGEPVWTVAYPDQTVLLTVGADGMARAWDASTDATTDRPIFTLDLVSGETDVRPDGAEPFDARFSPDGRLLVVQWSDGVARVWDMVGRKKISSLANIDASLDSAAFSADDEGLLTTSPGPDGIVRVWDLSGDKERFTIAVPNVTDATFSADGQFVVTANADGVVQLWRATDGTRAGADLLGHTNVVNSAQFSPDAGRVVSASSDDMARMYWVRLGDLKAEVRRRLAGERLTCLDQIQYLGAQECQPQ